MSTTIRFTSARRQSIAIVRGGWLDGGSLEVYTTPVPANADVAISTQTKLCTYSLPDPIGQISGGVITGDSIDSPMCIATGTAAFGRAKDSSGVVVGDFLAGLTGAGYAIEFDSLDFVSGAYAPLSAFTIVEG